MIYLDIDGVLVGDRRVVSSVMLPSSTMLAMIEGKQLFPVLTLLRILVMLAVTA